MDKNNKFQFLLRQSQDRLLGQKGISLVETVVALGLLGIIAVVFMTALYTISHNRGIYEDIFTASVAAQSQIEEIKASSYRPLGDYPVSIISPPGYNISINSVGGETGKQEVTVAVSWGKRGSFQLKAIKSDR